jgi:hypothetical protein
MMNEHNMNGAPGISHLKYLIPLDKALASAPIMDMSFGEYTHPGTTITRANIAASTNA